MANTEGMPDDFIASLATVGAAYAGTKSKSRRDWLNQRMELPMGESPAAKVVRASPSGGGSDKNSGDGIVERTFATTKKTATTSAPKLDAATSGISMPLVGDIVEHQPKYKSSSNRASAKAKISRFAQRQQQQHATGFPSVHIPLGTFVKPKQSDIRKAAAKASVPSNAHASNNDNIFDASKNDAQVMLSNMSLDEIKQAQHELQGAISPEMLAFLRDRNKKKETGKSEDTTNNSPGASHDDDSKTRTKKTKSSADKPPKSMVEESETERAEKERIAKLISSVQTHEDLDAAFRAEMRQNHPLDKEPEELGNIAGTGEDLKKFHVACDLLRSTSPRQNLWAVRIVANELETLANDPSCTTAIVSRSSLPDVLSVSLRCLLDKPVTSTYLLQTYTLQSLYFLTIIYAHPSHRILISSDDTAAKNMTNIYQRHFLDDAVPVPPLDVAYPPLTVQPLSIDESAAGSKTLPSTPAAYAAGSSTTSALKDGQDFQKDPMWTLLSRMKIIPRLAFLLQNHSALMPVEAWVAVCGLLCMVGQRSPGAASAIVQHDTLVSCLVKRILEQLQSGSSEDSLNVTSNFEMIPYSVLTLFCTLARQSKVAAEGIPLQDILPPILAIHATSSTEHSTQQSALILWRIVLRYGLGLDALASMLTISARHMALPYSNKFSLTSEFLSAFSQILECLRVFKSKNNEDFASDKISLASMAVLETAAGYMSSTIKAVLPHSSTRPDHVLNDDSDGEQTSLVLRFRFNGARLMYLSSWLHLFDSAANIGEGTLNVSLQDYFSSDAIESMLSALEAWTSSGGDLERSWKLLSRHCSCAKESEDLDVEASASAFMRGFSSLALVLSKPLNGLNIALQDVKQRVIIPFNKVILHGLEESLKSQHDVTNRQGILARDGWINQSHFAAAKLVFQAMSLGSIGSSSDLTLMRSMVFSLLARLARGDESIAAVLFSSDALFQTTLHEDAPNRSSSAISSLFLGELCGSNLSREQLDHSFKLCHGFGLTSSGWGPFGLHSLTSTVDRPFKPSASKTDEEKEGQLLPLEDLWLWKTLSGTVRIRDNELTRATKEAMEVIADVLQLILEQEEAEEVMNVQGYCSSQPTGGKLYYLMNVCLQSDQVLGDDRISESAEAILDRYLQTFGSSNNDIKNFCKECFLHSTLPAKNTNEEDGLEETKLSDQEALVKFVESEGESLSTSVIPTKYLRSLETFVEDIAKSYREYGAQFDFCTESLRAFLLPAFPSSIRCRVLQDLDGMHHLLTLPKEVEDSNEIAKLLSRSISGGLACTDNSAPDSTDILNKAIEILANGTRLVDGYMRAFCIALIARNLGSSLNRTGLQTVKSRLMKLDDGTVKTVCYSTALTVRDGGTKDAIIQSVLKAMLEETMYTQSGSQSVVTEQFVDECISLCYNKE